MTYCAQRKKNTAIIFCVLFFILAAACGVLSALGIGWRSVWQILLAACLVTVIQITQRYLLSGYEYILDPLDEINVYNRITVIRVQGERRTSVFTVPLTNLTAVERYCGMKKLKAKYGRISAKMNFCPDMRPKESYAMMFEVNGVLTAVRIQCGADFASELEKRMGV